MDKDPCTRSKYGSMLPNLAGLSIDAANRCHPCSTGVKLVFAGDTDCPICLIPIILTTSDPRIALLDDADLEQAARPAASLSCGHVFHTQCLQESFSRLPSAQWACPNDRQPLIDADRQHLITAQDAAETAARVTELQSIRQRMQSDAERALVDAERLAQMEASAQARAKEEQRTRERELANDDDDSEFLERLSELRLEFELEDAKRAKKAAKRRAARQRRQEVAAASPPAPPPPPQEMRTLPFNDRNSVLCLCLVSRAIHRLPLELRVFPEDMSIPPALRGLVADLVFKSTDAGTIEVFATPAEREPFMVFSELTGLITATVRMTRTGSDGVRATSSLGAHVAKSFAAMLRRSVVVRFHPRAVLTRWEGAVPAPLTDGLLPAAFGDPRDVNALAEGTNA